MGIIAMNALAGAQDLSHTERLVLWALALNADDGPYRTFQSIATLAHNTGLSDRTVQRSIVGLERRGFLTCQRGTGRGHATVYTINTDRMTFKPRAVKGVTSCHPSPVDNPAERVTAGPVKGDRIGVKGDTSCHPTLTPNTDSKSAQVRDEQPKRRDVQTPLQALAAAKAMVR